MNCLCNSFVLKKFIIPSEKKKMVPMKCFTVNQKVCLAYSRVCVLLIVACNVDPIIDSLQCGRILGGRNLVHVRIA